MDLQNAVIAKARLDPVNDLTKVKDWINQTYADACVETEANITTSTMAFTAGTSSYTLSSSIVRIKGMYVTPVGGAQSQPMQATTLDDILTRRQASGGASAAQGHVTHYALLGVNDFEVYPTPAAADVLTMWYLAQPTALSADTDVPILQEPYASKLLEYGALSEAADWKGDPSEQEYRTLYQVWMQKYRAQLTRKMGGQPGQFRVMGNYGYPPHDPSTDLGY